MLLHVSMVLSCSSLAVSWRVLPLVEGLLSSPRWDGAIMLSSHPRPLRSQACTCPAGTCTNQVSEEAAPAESHPATEGGRLAAAPACVSRQGRCPAP